MPFALMKTMSLFKLLGTAATGISAAAGAKALLGGGACGKRGGRGGGSSLLSGAASLLGAAGKAGSGGGGRGGKGGGCGCQPSGLDLVSALAGLGGRGSAGKSRGQGRGGCRQRAQDGPPCADAVQNDDVIDVTVEEAGQVQSEEISERTRASALFLQSCIVSSTPGRVRLRHRALEASPLLEKLRLAASALQGVRTAEAKPSTGSLLLTYDAEATDLAHVLVPLVSVIDSRAAEAEALPAGGDARTIGAE